MKFSEQRDLEYRFGKAGESLDQLVTKLAKEIDKNPKITALEHQRNIAETIFSVAPARVLIDLLGVAIYRAAILANEIEAESGIKPDGTDGQTVTTIPCSQRVIPDIG